MGGVLQYTLTMDLRLAIDGPFCTFLCSWVMVEMNLAGSPGLILVKLNPPDRRPDRKRFFLQRTPFHIATTFPGLQLRMLKHFFRKYFRTMIKQSRRGRECVIIIILIHFFLLSKAKEKLSKNSAFRMYRTPHRVLGRG
ncbi:hypothetical protein EBAPG3_14910 [Nitrosospira lacus]|nr:hypothetical protein EBAPG3_14910 [Nitrosospira lacus]